MRKKQYRLPDGKMTANPQEYVSAWGAIYGPICQKFELDLIGFDPGFLFKKRGSGATVDIPLWFAQQLVANN